MAGKKLYKTDLTRDITINITDITPVKSGQLLVKQDGVGGHNVILGAGIKGEVKIFKEPHSETLIQWVNDDTGSYVWSELSQSISGSTGGGGYVDLSNYYNKSESDSIFYSIENLLGFITGYTETDTLSSVISRGNTTDLNVEFKGVTNITGTLNIPDGMGGIGGSIFIGVPGSTGYTAPIVAYLDDLQDVSISTPSTGQALVYDGSIWKNQSVVTDLSNYYTKSQSDNRYLSTGTTLFNGDYNSLSNKPDLSQYALIDGSNAFGDWSINIYGTADYSYISDFAYNADFANNANQAETSIYWGNISSEIISQVGTSINRLLGVDPEGYARQYQVSTVKSWLGLGSAAFKDESGGWNIDIYGTADYAHYAYDAGYATYWGGAEANFDSFGTGSIGYLVGYDSDATNVIKPFQKDKIQSWLGLGASAYQAETLQSITNRGNTTPNSISTGDIQTTYLRITQPEDVENKLNFGWADTTGYIYTYNFQTGDRNNFSIQPDGGFVGIGTFDPHYTLDVGGTARATNVIATNSLVIPTAPPTSMQPGNIYLYIGT